MTWSCSIRTVKQAGKPWVRFPFPRQRRDVTCAWRTSSARMTPENVDVVAFHVVTMGRSPSQSTQKLFEADAYREYLELHGLSVQLTEALAEMWHARIRSGTRAGGE